MCYLDHVLTKISETEKAVHSLFNCDMLETPSDFSETTRELLKLKAAVEDKLRGLDWEASQRSRDLNTGTAPRHVQNRALVSQACQHFHHNIPNEITRIQRELQLRIDSHNERERELRAQGVAADKIPLVLPPVTDTERAEVALKVQALQEEREKLETFITSLNYDTALLAGTRLEQESAEA